MSDWDDPKVSVTVMQSKFDSPIDNESKYLRISWVNLGDYFNTVSHIKSLGFNLFCDFSDS